MKYSNLFYWNVGKKVYDLRKSCNNPSEYVSNFCSYTFGNSEKFNRENVNYMKNFYLCFPIYLERYNELSWSHFKLLITINNRNKRNFYLWIILFCKSSVEDLQNIINNMYYERII